MRHLLCLSCSFKQLIRAVTPNQYRQGSIMTLKQRKLLETYEHLTEKQIRYYIDLNKDIAAEASANAAKMQKLLKLRNRYESED